MLYRFIFLILLCTSIVNQVGAQTADSGIKEWAPIGAKWWYTYSGAGQSQHYLTLESVKDTVVQGKDSRILDIEAHYADGFFLDTASTISYFENTDYGPPRIILHQQGDSIFYLRKNKFELLYDFSLKVRDTMTVVEPQRTAQDDIHDTLLYMQIDEVTATIIDGQKLRLQKRELYPSPVKYNSGYLTGDTVIEKIGDNAFFLPYKDLECDAICPYKLRCYQDDSIFYKAVDMPCDFITPLESSNFALLESENVILYPNPVPAGMGRLQVEGIPVDSWILHDLQGRVLYKQKRKFDGRSIKIPVDLQAGMYFLELQSKGGRYMKRIIVQ